MPITALQILDIKESVQKTDNWCWAASAEMLSAFANGGTGIPQCEHADKAYGKPPGTCCGDPGGCNTPGAPVFDRLGYTVQKRQSNEWLTWDEAVVELDKSPFAAEQFYNSGGHMVVVRGYAIVNGIRLIAIFDPAKPDGRHSWRAYDDYRTGLDFTPGVQYFRVRKAAPGGSVASPAAPVATQPPPAVSLTAQAAVDAGEEMIKLLAEREPDLLGFVTAQEASAANIEVRGAQEVEILGETNPTAPPVYRRIFVNDKERGLFGMLAQGNGFRPVSFEVNPASTDLEQARESLIRLDPLATKPTLVYLPHLGRYLLKTSSNKYLPVGKIGDLKSDELYSLPDITQKLKLNVGPLIHKP